MFAGAAFVRRAIKDGAAVVAAEAAAASAYHGEDCVFATIDDDYATMI